MNTNQRITILDPLRGIAAVAVMLYHYTNGSLLTLANIPGKDFFAYGKYGVDIFFVLSGFVIPYTIAKNANYGYKYFITFIAKRLARLMPPYYFSIILSVLLFCLPILFFGRPINGLHFPTVNWQLIIGHLILMSPVFDAPWINPVFWTLFIELQYYILIGLLYPIIKKFSIIQNILLLTTLLLLSYLNFTTVFRYISLFAVGYAFFMYYSKVIKFTPYLILVVVLVSNCWLVLGTESAMVASATFLTLTIFCNSKPIFGEFLGNISYSLYLGHIVIGFVADYILKNIQQLYNLNQYILLLACCFASIAYASFAYYLIEKPSINWSKKIQYE